MITGINKIEATRNWRQKLTNLYSLKGRHEAVTRTTKTANILRLNSGALMNVDVLTKRKQIFTQPILRLRALHSSSSKASYEIVF